MFYICCKAHIMIYHEKLAHNCVKQAGWRPAENQYFDLKAIRQEELM